MRVGIEFAYKDEGWMGGVNGIANLLHALSALPARQVEPVLIARPDTPAQLFRDMPPVEILRTALVDTGSRLHLARRLTKRAFHVDTLMTTWLRQHRIEIFSHCEALGRLSSIPTIGQLADFSYRYFSDLYPADVLATKDAGTARVCNEHDTVMMPSRAVATDYRLFFPNARAKEAPLHIIPSTPRTGEKGLELEELTRRYDVPDRFLYCPNQFWVHKNHEAIIDALALAAARGKEIHVVSTGAKGDDRRPKYFGEFMRKVEENGVADRFHVLGLIPLEHTTDLMRHCIAVVTSSLFEGWGLTVAEAKAMGKTVILSDIPVFREQDPEHAFYFDPKRPDELAEHMISVIDAYSPTTDMARQAEADNRWRDAVRDYALGYERIVLETLGRKAGTREN